MSATLPRPACAEYASASAVEHCAWWLAEHCEQSIDKFAGEPLVLEPWQMEIMSEALAVDEDGHPFWKTVAIVLPRKNGKSTLLAAYAAYHADTWDGQPEVLLTASSDKQAGRLFDYLVSFARRSEHLRSRFHIREYIGELARTDGGGKILRMASDPGRLHGFNPSLVIVDELHAWTKPGLRKAWAALTSGGGARNNTQTFVISTAGEAAERADGILGRLIDANEAAGQVERPHEALTISRNFEARVLVYNFRAPVALDRPQSEQRHDLASIRMANPASWITDAYLRAQAASPELTDAEFLQLHGGVWAVGMSTWINPLRWAERAEADREIDTPVCLGFDGSYRRDATALVGCTLDGHLFVVDVWERPTEAPDDWQIPRADVDAAVDEAMNTMDVVELACDPPGWHAEIDGWREAYGERVVIDYPTNVRSRMAAACDRFWTGITDGGLTHADDPVLTRHVTHLAPKETSSGRIVQKAHPDRKIDAAICAIIAYDRAQTHAASRNRRHRTAGFA